MVARQKKLISYFNRIQRWLPCGREEKQRIMEKIRLSVGAYLEDYPEADLAQVQAHFGPPRQIASAYVEDLDSGELLNAIRIKRKIVVIVSGAALAVLLSWSALIGWEIFEVYCYRNGSYEIRTHIVDEGVKGQ